MITEKSVDTQSFEEIFNQMRQKIAEIYPEWNDYNQHDPGITLLELFAFLNEAQNYRMNRTSDRIYQNFLRLAFDLPATAKPAQLQVDLQTTHAVNQHDEFVANGLVFKAQEDVMLLGDVIDYIQVGEARYTQNFHPFTAQPAPDTTCTLALKQALAPNVTYVLTVTARAHPQRNPITTDFVRLATIDLYYGESLLDYTDTSYGFLQSGVIHFTVPATATDARKLTFRLRACDYDVAPWIAKLSFSSITLLQQDAKAIFCTRAQRNEMDTRGKMIDFYQKKGDLYSKSFNMASPYACVYDADFYHRKRLAVGNGFPNQSYRLQGDYLLEPLLLVEHPVHKGYFEQYTCVVDFEGASPTDRIFCMRDNAICFGDGICGRCPEGEIIVVALRMTKGVAGNLAKGNVLQSYDRAIVLDSASSGGCDPQTIQQMFEIPPNPVPTRLVTARDFEQAIRHTTGLLIADCKTLDFPAENTVSVVVQPLGNGATLSPKYKENITKFLEPRRLLGSEIKIYSPIYTEVEIFLDVVRSPLYLNAKQAVERALQAYFQAHTTFGAVTEYSVLYQKIDALDEIVQINAFHISARGDGVQRNRKGDVITLPNSITLLKNADILVNDLL